MKVSYLKRLLILSLLCFEISNTYSQSLEDKINTIDKKIRFINENKDNRSIFNTIFTDGVVHSKKRFLGILKTKKVVGGFAEDFIMKDSILVEVFTGTRIFLNKEKTISTNTVVDYVFENEKLCYYLETKKYEMKNQKDSLVYEIEYYIENETVLKTEMKGNFNLSIEEYLKQIIKNSETKIVDKNDFEK